MKFKKLDVKEIVKEAFLDSKKQAGYLIEQNVDKKESIYKKEDFDLEKHLSYIQIRPKEWGRRGTFQANEIDNIINAIAPGVPQVGLERFKICLEKMNEVLGKKPGEFGVPSGQVSASAASVNNLAASILLNHLIHSIIYAQEAGAAGKILEGLVSRMFGGSSAGGVGEIEDITYEDGKKLVSLKLLDPNQTKVKGSNLNLLRALSKEPDREITYLVCEKDKESDPFSFKPYTFSINRNNVFPFLFKKQDVTDIELDDIINQLNVIRSRKEQELKKKPLTTESLKSVLSEAKDEFINNLIQYGKSNAIVDQGDDEATAFKKIKDYIVPIFTKAGDQYTNSTEEQRTILNLVFPSLSSVKDIVAASSGGIKQKRFIELTNDLIKLRNELANKELSVDLLQSLMQLNSNEQLKNVLMSPQSSEEQKKNAKVNIREKFKKDVSKLIPQELVNFISDFQKFSKEGAAKQMQQQPAQPAYTGNKAQTILSMINQMESEMPNIFSNAGLKIKDNSFEVTTSQIRQFAGPIDESMPRFIVESGFLLQNASEQTKTLKQWLEPIYKEFYSVDISLKKYFIEDIPEGMTEAGQSAEKLKEAVVQHPGAKGVKASEITSGTVQTNPALQESKQKNLTKHWSSDILDWVQK